MNIRVITVILGFAIPAAALWLYIARHMPLRYVILSALLTTGIGLGVGMLRKSWAAKIDKSPYLGWVLEAIWGLLIFVVSYFFYRYLRL